MVVPVLMTSCQVSEKSKNGPEISHAIMMNRATIKAMVVPVKVVAEREMLSKMFVFLLVAIRNYLSIVKLKSPSFNGLVKNNLRTLIYHC